MNNIQVKKASGELEAFSEEKVRQSLQRAGAKAEVIEKIIIDLKSKLHDGISTRAIYKQVFNLLNQLQEHQGYRYSLKEALMKLGPSGYPFEKFIGKLLEYQGYKTRVNVEIMGKCVSHEIDVIAEKNNETALIECKFHNHHGIKTRVKTALYVQARFEDVVEKNEKYKNIWLVTNTKLTDRAISYGECKGMKMLAWRYPQENSLEQMIEKSKLLPVTVLSFLSQKEIRILMDNNIVVCRDAGKITAETMINWGIEKEKAEKIKQVITSFL